MPGSRRLLWAMSTVVALLVTCATYAVQRTGTSRMVEGERWCTTPAPCAVRVLGAGYPFAYMVDNPQVSVPDAIGLIEDDFRIGAFLLDWLLFVLLLLPVVTWVVRRVDARRR